MRLRAALLSLDRHLALDGPGETDAGQMQDERRKPPTLDEVLDRMALPRAKPRPGLHSPVYEAMWDAHDDLAPHLNKPRRPDWTHVAEKFAARGLLDGNGQPPNADATRKTWWKVRWDKKVMTGSATPRRRRRADPNEPTPKPTAEPRTPTPRKTDPDPAKAAGEDDELTLKWAVDPE
jgi:hypothetical protein